MPTPASTITSSTIAANAKTLFTQQFQGQVADIELAATWFSEMIQHKQTLITLVADAVAAGDPTAPAQLASLNADIEADITDETVCLANLEQAQVIAFGNALITVGINIAVQALATAAAGA